MSSGTPTVWTIGALLQWTEQFFQQHAIENPRLDAQVLLASALQCRRTDLYVRYDWEPPSAQRGRFREMVKARAAGMPVAYIVGAKEFYLLEFEVSPAVLVPRPATETLVLAALEAIRHLPAPRILDVGTGSGCVAVAIGFHQRNSNFVATDISEAALAIARRNVARHELQGRITLVECDLFSAFDAESQFDLIVANPPYIPANELNQLMKDVRDHEPRIALDGGVDGLKVIRQLCECAQEFLKPGGLLMVEVGFGQADAVIDRFQADGYFDVTAIKDADGVLRVVRGRKPAG